MHELSIANALIRLAEQYRPTGHRVAKLSVRAGPLQSLDELAMDWAWQAARVGTAYEAAALDLEMLPWSLHCRDCGCRWQDVELADSCACGSRSVTIDGSDELLLMSLEVDREESNEACKSPSWKTS